MDDVGKESANVLMDGPETDATYCLATLDAQNTAIARTVPASALRAGMGNIALYVSTIAHLLIPFPNDKLY